MLAPVQTNTITPTRDLTIDCSTPAPLSFAGVASDCAAESKRNDGQASTSAANGHAVSLGIHREQLSQTQSDYLELRNQRMDTNRRLLIANARAKAGKAAYVNNVKATSPEWIRPHRVGRCQTRASSAVGIYRTATAHGDYTHFSGIETCGSPWACPNCSAKARRALAEKLNEAFITIAKSESGLNAGLFMTLTLRHNKTIPLKTSLSTLQKAYESMRRTSRWKTLMKRLGHVGIVRTTEITYSIQNGWHPHFHCWLVTDGRVSDVELAAADALISELWVNAVKKHSDGKAMIPNLSRGCDLRRVTSDGLTAYIAKTPDAKENPGRTKLANEMARFDLKTARSNTSIMPFELLDMGEEVAHLWIEYVEATTGRRSIAWSKELKNALAQAKAQQKQIPVPYPDLAPKPITRTLLYVMDGTEYDRKNAHDRTQILIDTKSETANAAQNHGVPSTMLLGRALPTWLTANELTTIADSIRATGEIPSWFTFAEIEAITTELNAREHAKTH